MLIAAGVVADLRALALNVTPPAVPRRTPRELDDDHVLARATASSADLIVSGDRRDVLPLQTCQGVPIVSLREAFGRLTV